MSSLAKRLSRGDRSAFARLYDLCADRVHHYLVVRLGSREQADDILQTTFVRLASSEARFESVNDPVAYTFAVARNEANRLMDQERRNNQKRILNAALLFQTDSPTEPAEEVVEFAAYALNRLSDEHREIVELKIYAGLTFREIAGICGLPQGTAATRYRTALQVMRDWAEKELS